MGEGVGGHDLVMATLAEMGVCAAPMRTILIRNGYFLGHKYGFHGGYAVLLRETNVIEIYDDDGQLQKTVALETLEKATVA